jgi:cysteinyl-tRNA synthetase
MRLFDTLTKTKVELPESGPIRMYFCGPTVYQRAHIGNARPYILGMWLRNWLRAQGRDVKLVHNITDINDRIYEAAPGASAELAVRATQWYLEDTDALGLGRPDELPKASEYVPQIVHFISELIERGYAYEVEGDVYFRVARDPEYGQLSGQRPDQVEEQEPNPRKEDPRDFALWKANKPDEDTSWDSPVGARTPRLAHRVLGHGGRAARPGVRDPRRRARSRLPAPRERGRAVARARAWVRPYLDAQRAAPLHGLEDVEVGGEHRHDPRGARPLGA